MAVLCLRLFMNEHIEIVLWFFVVPVLIAPALLIGTLILWWMIGVILEKVIRGLFPDPPPYCDIDPMCHPAFVWHKDGSGWIGNICVIKS